VSIKRLDESGEIHGCHWLPVELFEDEAIVSGVNA
jgi:hypothetical protein